jgi:hypothetical protein
MGQYYYPIYLGRDGNILAWMDAHMYNYGLKLTEHSYKDNAFVHTFECGLVPGAHFYKARVVWAGDYADCEPSGVNLHAMCTEYTMISPKEKRSAPRYILNHTKKLFVDKEKTSKYYYAYHPLPILTAEGNGRGGGDCEDSPLVGSWARDEISVEENHYDFVEVLFDMGEERETVFR